MMYYVRPFTITLLCTLAAFGQLPALLHIGSCAHHCGHDYCDHTVATSPRSGGQSIEAHGCTHARCSFKLPMSKPSSADDEHFADTASTEHSPTEHSPAEHDSDHCIVCQSLLSASLLERFEIQVTSQLFYGKFVRANELLFHSQSSVSIAAPRGPPSRV